MNRTLRTTEQKLEIHAQRIEDLEKELRLLRSIDLEKLIRNVEEEIILEKQNAQYLYGLKARIYGC